MRKYSEAGMVGLKMWASSLALIVIAEIVVLNAAPYKPCYLPTCPDKCKCNGSLAICTDVSKIPRCLPSRIENLTIEESPELITIGRRDFGGISLKELRMRDTGLRNVEQWAFGEINGLQVLEITSAKLLILNNETLGGMDTLTELKISCCEQWSSVSAFLFTNLPQLEHLDISSNGIQNLDGDSFYRLSNLLSLDMSGNKDLTEIPRYSLYRLEKLRNLRINNCNLQVLYPEHVMTPYNNNSLKTFLAHSNDWQCDFMCEFFFWVDDNPGFRNIDEVRLGFCSSPSYLQDNLIINLDGYNVCFNATVSGLVFMGLLFSSVLVLICCFLLAAKNCCAGLCGLEGEGQTTPSRPQNRPRGTVNQSSELDDDVASEHDGGDGVGSWRITDIDPPSYETVVKQRSGDEISLSHLETDDSDSMAGIPPPVYEEVNPALQTEASATIDIAEDQV